MGYEEVYRCTICGHLNVMYNMSNDPPDEPGHILYNYCENGCVFKEDPHCLIKGKSKLVKVM